MCYTVWLFVEVHISYVLYMTDSFMWYEQDAYFRVTIFITILIHTPGQNIGISKKYMGFCLQDWNGPWNSFSPFIMKLTTTGSVLHFFRV